MLKIKYPNTLVYKCSKEVNASRPIKHSHLRYQLQLRRVLPLLSHLLRRPQQGIQALQPRHLNASLARDAHGIAHNNLEFQLAASLPVQQHARARALVSLRAADDLLRRGHGVRERPAEDVRHGVADLVHDAEQMTPQLRIVHHVCVSAAAAEDGRRVHGGIDAQLVPPDRLQADLVVRVDILDAAKLGPQPRQLVGAHEPPVRRVHVATAAAVSVRSDADARPPVLADDARGGLLRADDGHRTDDGRGREASPEGLLDAHAVLDEHDARRRPDEGRNHGRVVAHVRESLGGHEDVVPVLLAARVRSLAFVRGCQSRGFNGGKSRLRVKSVVPEAVRFHPHARLPDGLIVGTGHQGHMDVFRRL